MGKEHDAYKKLCNAEDKYNRNRNRSSSDEAELARAQRDYARAKDEEEREKEENRRNYRSGNYLGGYNGYY